MICPCQCVKTQFSIPCRGVRRGSKEGTGELARNETDSYSQNIGERER